MRFSNLLKIKYTIDIKYVGIVFAVYIMNIAFYYICIINLYTEMKYSMKLQHCEIFLGQIGYIALFLLNYGLIA